MWFVIAMVAGATIHFSFDVRAAVVVIVVARIVEGRARGFAALLGGVVSTIVIATADDTFALALVAAGSLVVASVAIAHLVEWVEDRSLRRPLIRFAVHAAVLGAISLAIGWIEAYVVGAVTNDGVSHGWDRVAALAVAASVSLGAVMFARRRWRIGSLAVDELMAPVAALAVVVLAMQITGQVWRNSDRNNLHDAATSIASQLVEVASDNVNRLDARLDASEIDVSDVPSVVSVAKLSDDSSSVSGAEVVVGSSALVRALEDIDLGTDPGLVAGARAVIDERDHLVFVLEAASGDRYVAVLSVDRLLEAARSELAGLFRDVEFGVELGDATSASDTESSTRGAAVAVIDGVELRVTSIAGSEFGMSSTEQLSILGLEALLGLGVISVLLLGASSQLRVGIERARRESLLEAALDAIPGLSVVFDDSGDVLAANLRVRELGESPVSGRSVNEVLGFGADTVRARIVGELIAKALNGEHGNAEVIGDEDDRMRIIELEAVPVQVPGEDRVGLLLVTDTTERRNLAMRTAQAERMESLGALAGGLAHDFNNLLFVTLGNLQLMAMNETITGDEKLSKFLSRSMSAVERGAEITRSLLAVARSQPLEETAVSLADLIKGLLPLVKQAVGAGRTVEVDIPDPSLQLLVDAGRLQSCILNLAFNSRDAMGPNGTVRIAAREQDGMIELSVTDDGSGMPPDVVARAFEPFFTTKKAGSGTGLGLATVYAFAQQSGGTAKLQSRVGVGTTVTLVLPVHRPGSASTPAPSSRRSGRRVVVADDEQALAEMVAAWLIDVGVDARFALSPKTALELIAEFPPDVLVSDANFGEEQDGLDLARLATAGQPDLAVIFMTGYSSSMRQLQELGERTLAKPFSRDDLYAAVLPLLADDGASQGGEENG